ncbi:serine hydrolase domain-containing protein [Streptomyces yaizuensis]|uniref:Serine hydrolase n=1 Tax=Streptomyces yaizuensis TaxID=2989713 RepID=A0ABQ5P964_9ACTN|nr:serine hydrolase domain-containing protein [Streptomyces sp. YSPA8]GLF99133.1 serine hydrolase [Streptomyces sp. YSPA8]
MRVRPLLLHLFCLLCLLLLLTPPAAAASPGPEGRYAAIDTYLRDRMRDTRTPGLSYAVVGPDGPLHQRSWGTDGRGDPVTDRTPFLWGSVAKPIAATAVMTLVQEGRLRLDDPVTRHLPRFRFGGPAHASAVTVRHLLHQTAGIPASAALRVTDRTDADSPGPTERLAALDDVTPLGPPGTTYAYSSANYLALGAVVESVTGRPYPEHLRDSVLRPAGMDGAIADRASARKRNLSPGHRLLWGFPAATPDGVDDHGAAYGYTGGDLHDLAAFASFQLRSTRTATTGGDAVLTAASVREMRTEGRLTRGGEGTGYGFGWRVGGLEGAGGGAVWHTGATPGYAAALFLLPERNTALVIQQNLYGLLQDGAVMQTGFGAARILTGGDPGPVPGTTVHHLTVWGTTGLALALLLAAGRSVLLLRRPATARGWRRTVPAVLWCLVGAGPGVALALIARTFPLGQLTTWVPDAAAALWVAAAAGAVTAGLRLALALRPRRAPRTAPRTAPTADRRPTGPATAA